MRIDQIINKIVKNRFNETGTIPDPSEIAVRTEDVYKPQAMLVVPGTKAISDADKHNQVVAGMLTDFNDLVELCKELHGLINQLHLAVTCENSRAIAAINRQHRQVRVLAESSDIRNAYISDLPIPSDYSSGIQANGHITLRPSVSEQLEYTSIISPYSDNTIVDYTPLSKLVTPLHYKVKSKGTVTGINIRLEFNSRTITRITIDSSPAIAQIFVNAQDGTQKEMLRKRVNGKDTLQFDDVVANSITVRLFQYGNEAELRINALNVYSEKYVNTGTYISSPLKADYNGLIKLAADTYIPVGTLVKFYMASDTKVKGQFEVGGVQKDPDIDVSTAPMLYNTLADAETWLSKLYRYSLTSGIGKLPEPVWKEMSSGTIYYYNSLPGKIAQGDYGTSLNTPLVTLPSTVIPKSVRVMSGRNAWIFIPHASQLRIPPEQIESLGLNIDDLWTTYLVVKRPTDLTITNPNNKIKDIAVDLIETTTEVYPDLESMINRTAGTFSGKLTEGIYKIQLYVSQIDLAAWPMDISATEMTGIIPDQIVNYDESAAEIILYPWPARKAPTDFSHIDPIIRHQFYSLAGYDVYVPILARSTQYDIYHPDFEIADLYSSQSNLNAFYDISYIMEQTPDNWSEYLFFKVELTTARVEQSPVVRSIELHLVDEGKVNE